ncbi:hypothetical protein AG0111_0g13144 [Alternaria gaisen]|uniref:Uncharacterized protein n=1 Tax=Alternaria gaisen TaxID=167740 RepID=A0ACB6F226_9PLEO|nr:hypothetical protein AG0111_0g13144 [Alternaria gaisen]
MPFCTQWEADGEVPSHVLKRHAALGYAAALINPEWDEFHGLIVADEVARCGSLGVLWALGCGTAIACPILVDYGTEEQKAKFLPPVIHGESRFCLGITEPEVGSDIANLVTRAEQEGNYFIVNGTKKWAKQEERVSRFSTSPLDVAGVSREKLKARESPLEALHPSRSTTFKFQPRICWERKTKASICLCLALTITGPGSQQTVFVWHECVLKMPINDSTQTG